jgi:hypothetical protein
MSRSTSFINTLELFFGIFVFTILRQFSSDEVRIIFMVPVILLLSLPAGRFKQPILTMKNKFDMIYGFLGTVVILLIVFTPPMYANVNPTGVTYTIHYFLGSKEIPIEYLTTINVRATSILTILFLTVIPMISVVYTFAKHILNNGLFSSNGTRRKKSINIFDQD